MKQIPEGASRKKFLIWSAAVFSSIAVFGFFTGKKKKKKEKDVVRMLTQDGRLVEIDRSLLAAQGRKISDGELQKWIKK